MTLLSFPLPARVRAIYFDAVGTVLHPQPSAGAVYAEIGQRFGTALAPGEIHRRFVAAFRAEEEVDARVGHRTDEARELQRWRNIVESVLDDVLDREGCFDALYDHFARATAWVADPAAAPVLESLRRTGYQVGLATNFDHRLRSVLAGLPALAEVQHVVISSEVGWKKPAPPFFARLGEQCGLAPEEILLVGDDWDNDYRGARAAGLHARLLDPSSRYPVPGEHRLTSLLALIGGRGP